MNDRTVEAPAAQDPNRVAINDDRGPRPLLQGTRRGVIQGQPRHAGDGIRHHRRQIASLVAVEDHHGQVFCIEIGRHEDVAVDVPAAREVLLCDRKAARSPVELCVGAER